MAGIADIISGLVGGVGDAVSKVTNAVGVLPADKKAELTQAMATLQQQAQKAQTDVNAIEAANSNVFVSGWRPFVGWVSGIGFAWTVLFVPIVEGLAALFGHPFTLPQADPLLKEILTGMLGVSYLARTGEKALGVQANH